jgi:eukaryotic-like serine/threonine-protein kinase
MPGAREDRTVEPGDVLGGKYRVERLLGSGGMGFVVAARHVELDKRVAIKLMRADAARDPDNVERFLREARAAVRLRSEHCVHVIDVARLEDGTPYMVMELLAGRDLGAIVEREGPRSVSDAVLYVLQACEGIAEAHARGIVHRDVKLSNLVLTRRVDGRPVVKVLDFGLAKMVSTSRELRALTQSAAVMGSPMYMSPEQMRATRDVDVRTDVWSLGVCLYEMLTGRGPFEGATVPELCSMVLTQPPLPMPRDVPEGLAAAVFRCLQKEPAGRFRDVAELADAIETFAPDAAGAAHRIRTVLSEPHDDAEVELLTSSGPNVRRPEIETRTASSFDTTTIARSRRSGMILGAVLAGCVLVGAAVVGMRAWHLPQAPAVEATAAPDGVEPAVTSPVPSDVALAAPSESVAPLPSVAPPVASGMTPRFHRHGVPASKPKPAATPAPVLQPKTTQF